MAGIFPQRPHLGRGPQRIRDALGRALVICGKGHAYMAVIENGVVRPVGLLDLVEGLGDQKTLEAIAGHEGQSRLEEIEPAERGNSSSISSSRRRLPFACRSSVSLRPI